jgi:FAD:protein FMN transferase
MSGQLSIRHAEPVMGTVVSFDLRPHGLPYAQSRAALREACEVLHRADEVFSLYKEASPLSRLRRGELTLADCPPEVESVLTMCRLAREQSDGWFDPWAMAGGVDPTGLVKGWAAELAAEVLRSAGVGAAMVNAAGDIAVFGSPKDGRPWRIGVRSPRSPDTLLCVIDTVQAVATSGSYERGDHVRDTRTGEPASGALSATVCGPRLTFADAFATGLLAAGESGLSAVRASGYEAMIVRPDGTREQSLGFPEAVAIPR